LSEMSCVFLAHYFSVGGGFLKESPALFFCFFSCVLFLFFPKLRYRLRNPLSPPCHGVPSCFFRRLDPNAPRKFLFSPLLEPTFARRFQHVSARFYAFLGGVSVSFFLFIVSHRQRGSPITYAPDAYNRSSLCFGVPSLDRYAPIFFCSPFSLRSWRHSRDFQPKLHFSTLETGSRPTFLFVGGEGNSASLFAFAFSPLAFLADRGLEPPARLTTSVSHLLPPHTRLPLSARPFSFCRSGASTTRPTQRSHGSPPSWILRGCLPGPLPKAHLGTRIRAACAYPTRPPPPPCLPSGLPIRIPFPRRA